MQFTIQTAIFAALAMGLIPSALASNHCTSYLHDWTDCPTSKPHCMWTSGGTKICCDYEAPRASDKC